MGEHASAPARWRADPRLYLVQFDRSDRLGHGPPREAWRRQPVRALRFGAPDSTGGNSLQTADSAVEGNPADGEPWPASFQLTYYASANSCQITRAPSWRLPMPLTMAGDRFIA